MAYKLNRDDLVEHLREQVGFLRSSAAEYDRGNAAEAKRLAHILRVLLHDTKNSAALLGQLGELDRLRFLDTAHPFDPHAFVQSPPLLGMRASSRGIVFVPLLDNHRPDADTKPFDEWWSQVVATDMLNNLFSRRDFVMNLANKEGGSHVDPKLSGPYAQLARENSLGWMRTTLEPASVEPTGSPAAPTVRQIAYEVLESLRSLPFLADLY